MSPDKHHLMASDDMSGHEWKNMNLWRVEGWRRLLARGELADRAGPVGVVGVGAAAAAGSAAGGGGSCVGGKEQG